MKFFGFVLVLLLVASCHGNINVRNERAVARSVVDNLIEQLREILRNGDESLGLPVLDPLSQESFDFDIDNESAALALALKNLTGTGLAEFEATTLSFSLIGLKFNYAFNWPTLKLNTKYAVDGTVIRVIPVYGDGDCDVNLTDLSVSGSLGLSVSGGYLNVGTSTASASLGSFSVKLTGLFNNEEVSTLISEVASDMFVQLVEDFSTQIDKILNEIIINSGNQLLGTLTLAELIAAIIG